MDEREFRKQMDRLGIVPGMDEAIASAGLALDNESENRMSKNAVRDPDECPECGNLVVHEKKEDVLDVLKVTNRCSAGHEWVYYPGIGVAQA